MIIKPLTKNAPRPEGFWGKLMIRKMNAGHAEMTRWALGQLDLSAVRTAIDIGCGGGKAVKRLSKMAPRARIFGADRSPLCVEQSRRENRRAAAQGRVRIVEGSAGALPFPENSFDLATAVETVYFWEDWERCFRDVIRILKPGGVFAIVCDMVDDGDGDIHYGEVTQLIEMTVPTPARLREAMENAGFQNIQLSRHPQEKWLCATGKRIQ